MSRGSVEKKWLRDYLGSNQHFAPEMNVSRSQEMTKKESRGIFTRRIRTDSTNSDDGQHYNLEGPSSRIRSVSSGSESSVSNTGSGDVAHTMSQFTAAAQQKTQ